MLGTAKAPRRAYLPYVTGTAKKSMRQEPWGNLGKEWWGEALEVQGLGYEENRLCTTLQSVL